MRRSHLKFCQKFKKYKILTMVYHNRGKKTQNVDPCSCSSGKPEKSKKQKKPFRVEFQVDQQVSPIRKLEKPESNSELLLAHSRY